MTKTLSIIGAGKVGKTLGRLWSDARVFHIQDVMNRSIDAAVTAVAFIGAGRPVVQFSELHSADIYLLATPDDQLVHACSQLAQTGLLSPASLVFHCSGALPSSVLATAAACGAHIASAHPIRSFASPDNVVCRFAGTFCGIEGDAETLDGLRQAFFAIHAKPVTIDADMKTLYHAAAVFASNYTTTLLGIAQNAYESAGIAPEIALQIMEPLVRESIDNVFRLGPANALTGPVARGDMGTVERQQRAVSGWNAQYGNLYAQLVVLTRELAETRATGK
jgi:predicted short-subunit dehydrogenase-like oxidoreductase (DUF2520 family)